MKKSLFIIYFTIILFLYSTTIFATIKIIAAENFYGNIAKELGGEFVNVDSILNNPSQDPHLFSTTPSIAKAMSNADVIIYNGDNYDPWIIPLLNSQSSTIIDVSTLFQIPTKDNPHFWYFPDVIPMFAKKITEIYVKKDPVHQQVFEKNLQQFLRDYQKIFMKIGAIKKRFNKTEVTATESVFNGMLESCGFVVHGKNFQIKMMNDIPPSISEVKEFEMDLRNHRVKLLIFNDQVVNPLTQKMLDIARQEKIPVVGVTELMPPNTSYINWILKELDEIQQALEGSAST